MSLAGQRGGGPAGLTGALERRPGVGVVGVAGCEDGFGLGVALGLPGKHRQLVLFESEVVEAFEMRQA